MSRDPMLSEREDRDADRARDLDPLEQMVPDDTQKRRFVPTTCAHRHDAIRRGVLVTGIPCGNRLRSGRCEFHPELGVQDR